MSWHDDFPDWSARCYALAKQLSWLDDKDPLAPHYDPDGSTFALPDGSLFPNVEFYLLEAVDIIGPPLGLRSAKSSA